MIEQRVADSFQAAVEGEPPLGFDPDDVIDTAIKRSRRRGLIMGVAGATVVEVAVVWALAGLPDGDRGADQAPAAGPAPASAAAPAQEPPETMITVKTWDTLLTPDRPEASIPPGAAVMVQNLFVTNPDFEQGRVQLKNGDAVVAEVSLGGLREHDMHMKDVIIFQRGVKPTLAVSCESPQRCGRVRMRISGYVTE